MVVVVVVAVLSYGDIVAVFISRGLYAFVRAMAFALSYGRIALRIILESDTHVYTSLSLFLMEMAICE